MDIVEAITDKKDWDVEKDRTPYTLVDVNDLSTDQIFETYSKDNVVPVVAEWATLSTDFNETQLLKASESSEFALRRLSSPRLPRIESRFGSSRAKILAMVTFLLRGEVILYYGDEIGMTSSRQGKGDFNIDPMDWRAAESTTPTSEFYKNLIKIHNEMNQTQKDGGSTKFYTEAGVFAFKRETAKKFVVVTNVGGEKKVINIKKELDTTKKATVVSVTPGLVTPAKGDNVTVEEIALPPESGVVLELIPDEE
jgi:glycosidase